MQGRPPHCSGSTVILSIKFGMVLSTYNAYQVKNNTLMITCED
jgi:hypothetical protein